MTSSAHGTLLWSPRVLAIAVALFLGLFALDAFGAGRDFWEALPSFLRHLLPSVLLLVVAALAWRRAWLGGAAFLSLAAVYGLWAWRHPSWIALVSGPLALVGLLYLASWRTERAAAYRG